MNTTFPEERCSAEEFVSREEAQRRADEEEEFLALFGFSLEAEPSVLSLQDEPFPF